MSQVSFGDAARGKLRNLIEAIDREIPPAPPPGHGDPPTGSLHASWRELVQLLALGPPPETRVCPTCGGTGMRTASRCASCWSRLEPLPAVAHAAPPITAAVAAAVAHDLPALAAPLVPALVAPLLPPIATDAPRTTP